MKNILIVEDDKALAEGIVLVLRQDGFSFQCCHNVKDAKKVLEKNIFDLILLDINLPDGSGLDICRGLRKEERLAPVIFLTALDTELHDVTGFQAGRIKGTGYGGPEKRGAAKFLREGFTGT